MTECRNDRHLGHLLIEKLRERPGEICQIDAGTGESETNASVLSRAVRLARGLRQLGLKPGDVLALQGTNHLDLLIPFYAALFNGLTLVGVDPAYDYEETKYAMMVAKPAVVFTDSELVREAITKLDLDTKIITFKEGEHSMRSFMEEYDNGNESDAEFRVAEYDVEKIPIWLITTSGSTGFPKLTTNPHPQWMKRITEHGFDPTRLEEYRIGISLTPVQWISAYHASVGMPLFNYTILRSSAPPTTEHFIDIINTYKPKRGLFIPYLIDNALNHERYCDFTCFDNIALGGIKVNPDIITQLRQRIRSDAQAYSLYGATEPSGLLSVADHDTPLNSIGKPVLHEFKLVDLESGAEITEPHKEGELWVKGPMCRGYYRNPEQTAAAFVDGWYKTGDLVYRDEDNYYYYIERIGQLIKNGSYFISPWDLKDIIEAHPDVLEAYVTGVPSLKTGDHPIACVVRRPGHHVTAQEIKDFVAGKVRRHERLGGGVIFMEELPRTSTGKYAMTKLKQIALMGHPE
ncbi:unnamed protein product [Chrysodeixis includens]|uniref:Luciferase n=1 Tax=Chrysodeixis includens TaxID=689277 RepID=A0A9P0BN79_CHRIL|nr:unnamed protein product [Chrysodeixis includens]